MQKLTVTAGLLLLAACGGGGGGVDVSIARVDPPEWNGTGYAGLPAPTMSLTVSFRGDLAALNGRTIYLAFEVPGPAYGLPSFTVDTYAETLQVTVFALGPEPVATFHQGTAHLYLCLDAECKTQLGGSPWPVPYTFQIAPGIRFSPAEVVLEAPFGELPAPVEVAIDLPGGATQPSFTGVYTTPLRVAAAGAGGPVTVTPRLAPAGSYTGTAEVAALVPDPVGYGQAHLRAALPVTWRVLPNPARPFLLLPESQRYDFKLASTSSLYSSMGVVSLLEQVPGGRLEVVGATYLSAPAAAAGHPDEQGWIGWFTASSQFMVRACAAYGGVDCLPPGSYQGLVRYRYTAADDTVTEADHPVEMVIDACCGEACADLQADTANCGACFHACGSGWACNTGQCECGPGRLVCWGRCLDPQTDQFNCGGCGTVCLGAQTCVDGRCCPGGLTACGAACVDLASSAAHCGACGATCPAPRTCLGGACACANGGEVCDFACKELQRDPQNCGACRNACNPEQACVAGACQCPAGESVCGQGCVDLQADRLNCGACGTACLAGEACLSGQCACPAGSQACGTSLACIDLATDAHHCGACDAPCPAGQTCVAGGCAADVAAFPTYGAEPGRSGVNAGETGVPPLAPAWAVVGAAGLGPVALQGGRVVTLVGRQVMALEASSGALLWTHDLGVNSAGHSWPTLDGGQAFLEVVAASGGSRVRRLDRGTGALTGEAPVPSQAQPYLSPLVVGDALFTGGGTYGGLLGFDLGIGVTERFFLELQGSGDHWGAAWRDGAVFTLLRGTLRRHDPATGAVTASRVLAAGPGADAWFGSAAFGATLGFTVSPDGGYGAPGTLHAFHPADLSAAWSLTDKFFAWPAVAGDTVLALDATVRAWDGTGRLRALAAADGTPRWTFAGDGKLVYPPVVAAGFAYVASGDNVYAVDLATGLQAWTAPVGGRLAVGDGHLFVSDYERNRLVAFRLTR